MINPYYYWQPQFTKKEIKELNKFIENNYCEEENSKVTAQIDGVKLKHDNNTKLIRWYLVKPYLQKVYGYADYVLTHDYGFLTYPYPDDKFINLTTYTSKQKDYYKWHLDQESKATGFDIKGTLLINVSEEKYEGGDLKIFYQGEIIIDKFKEPGSMVLFHGFVNHEVTPVTKGTRKTIAVFFGGPKWR